MEPTRFSRVHEEWNPFTWVADKINALRPVEKVVVGVASLALTGLAYQAIRRVFAASVWQGLAVAGLLSGVGIYLCRKYALSFLLERPTVEGKIGQDRKVLDLEGHPLQGRWKVNLPNENIQISAAWDAGVPSGDVGVYEGTRVLAHGYCEAGRFVSDDSPVILPPMHSDVRYISANGQMVVGDTIAPSEALEGEWTIDFQGAFISAQWQGGVPHGYVVVRNEGKEVTRGRCQHGSFVEGRGTRDWQGAPLGNLFPLMQDLFREKGRFVKGKLDGKRGERWNNGVIWRGEFQKGKFIRGECIDMATGKWVASGEFSDDASGRPQLHTGFYYEEPIADEEKAQLCKISLDPERILRRAWPEGLSRERRVDCTWWSFPLPPLDIRG